MKTVTIQIPQELRYPKIGYILSQIELLNRVGVDKDTRHWMTAGKWIITCTDAQLTWLMLHKVTVIEKSNDDEPTHY